MQDVPQSKSLLTHPTPHQDPRIFVLRPDAMFFDLVGMCWLLPANRCGVDRRIMIEDIARIARG